MKKVKFIKQTAAALIVAVLGQITMTTIRSNAMMHFYLGGTGEATIDWGDGSIPQTVTLSTSTGYYATLSGSPAHTIVIRGQDITRLECTYMQLTAIDVTKNTVLTDLGCNANQLEAPMLNALFGTLNEIAGYKYLSISDNPGADDCDIAIAEEKGWRVR